MHSLEACFFKNINVSAFRIYALHGEDVSKRVHHGNNIDDYGKSWNYIFEFLWEACDPFPTIHDNCHQLTYQLIHF